MGFLPSSSTIYAEAYLTELARQYLFGNSSKPRFTTRPDGTKLDRFLVTQFSLGDPDVNYKLPIKLSGGTVPNISGENETALKAAKGRDLTELITPEDASFENEIEVLEYKSSIPDIRVDFSKPVYTIPTIYTVQLLTFVNGQNTQDGLYIVTPTSYGPNQAVNGELIIPLREPTVNQTGYRMRIFYPTSGSDYNKITVQFEQGFYTTGNIIETYTKTFQPTSNVTNFASGGLTNTGEIINSIGVNLQNITIS
jgi:hypothetical protein